MISPQKAQRRTQKAQKELVKDLAQYIERLAIS